MHAEPVGALGSEQVPRGTCVILAETGNCAAALIVVALEPLEASEERGASAGGFRLPARNTGSLPLVSSGHGRRHMPQTSTGVPANSSLRWNTFSFHGFSPRSKITKWPASAPHRSM